MGPWFRTPKTKRELRGAIFKRKFSPKIPQPHVCIERYAIFSKNGSKAIHCLGSWAIYTAFISDRQIAYMFISIPQILQECQFFYFFQSHSILRNYRVSRPFFRNPVRLECRSHLGEYAAKLHPTGPGGPRLTEKTEK